MFNLSFLSCVRHLNFKRWIETINSTTKKLVTHFHSFSLFLKHINEESVDVIYVLPWFSIADLILCSMPSCFHFVIGIFLVLCVFFREIWSRYWIFYGMFNPTKVDVISHSFISLGISIDWTSVYKHANASALWFFVYLFIYFFSWCTSFSYHNHIFTTKVICTQAHQQHIYAHTNTLYYYQTYAFTQAYRSI